LLQDLARDPAESREPEAGGLQETQG